MTKSQSIFLYVAIFTLLLCLCGAVLSGFGAQLGLWGFVPGLNILKWSVYLTAAPVTLAILSAIIGLVKNGHCKDFRYLAVLLVAALVFGIPYYLVTEFRKTPTLADATTNFVDSPAFVDLVSTREETSNNPLEYRAGEAIELQKLYFPNLATSYSKRSPAELIKDSEEIANHLGWALAAAVPSEGRLEATATTFWFGFKDDIIIRARITESGETAIDARSASRVGYGDGGVNAKRIQHFLSLLTQE